MTILSEHLKNPYISIKSASDISVLSHYLDIEGEAGAEAGREEGEENEDNLRWVTGAPPDLQPESEEDMEDILLRDTELDRQWSAVSGAGG